MPFEVAGSFMKQEAENIEADIEKLERGMASLEGQLAQEQRTRSAWRFLHLGQDKRFWNDKRRYSQAELSEVQSQVSTLREMMEEAKRNSRRAHLKVLNTTFSAKTKPRLKDRACLISRTHFSGCTCR
jgi:hypothetical protein